MFNWLRRRRLSDSARKKLLIFAARAEEEIIETHIANLVDLLDTLGEELDLDRALELYMEMMGLQEPLSTTVANRLLARLEGPAEKSGGRFKHIFRDSKKR
jgi:hypothetical protein